VSPLKTELENLKKRFAEDEVRLQKVSDDFWRNGGICCPGCGVRGFLDLQFKQERRLLRMDGIKKKLECS
jgi:hypothetical protein